MLSSFSLTQMRKASKRPSEWLKLLCKDWAEQNEALVEMADAKFLEYKPYLKGVLTSQRLCRLSVSSKLSHGNDDSGESPLDLWLTLGISDGFDREYIVSQVSGSPIERRVCSPLSCSVCR